MASYEAIHGSWEQHGYVGVGPDAFSQVAEHYIQSDRYKALKPRQQADYRRDVDNLRWYQTSKTEALGNKTALRSLRRRCVRSLNSMPSRKRFVGPRRKHGKPRAANSPHWSGLSRFLEDGRLEPDTNPVENQIRKTALTRKNALFAGHEVGAKNWAMLARLIANCKMCDIDPVSYLTNTLQALLDGHPKSRIDELMPWNYDVASSRAA